MPELPEVETIRRQLAPAVEGRRLERLEILDPRWCEPLAPHEVGDAVAGRVVEELGRRGKYLVFALEGDVFLLCHLRMTGTMLVARDRYLRVVFHLGGAGPDVHFCDPRRFGTGELALGTAARDAFFAARLGIEPLGGELTGERLRALAKGRRAPVKSFLLDQRRIAGVGNIYADEALFQARVHPLRPAGSLRPVQYEALAEAVRDALAAGLAAGGATIDDFRHADGVAGAFQNDFRIHLREGEPCLACGRRVVKFWVGGRGTYVCESCQPRPRRRTAGPSAGPRGRRPPAP
jgi:formamidopyrimidine-DNA glycosylase